MNHEDIISVLPVSNLNDALATYAAADAVSGGAML
jgi:hypothetical protein